MNGVILEGIPAVGKTRVLQALRERDSFQRRSSTLVLGEHYTERAIEQAPAAPASRYEKLMYRLLACLEPLRVLTVEGQVFQGAGELQLTYLFERFHLTNILTHGGSDLAMLQRVENTLRLYYPTVVLLTVAEDEIETRLRDTVERRTDCWREFLFRHGRSWDEVAFHYADQQNAFVELYGASELDKQSIDMSRTSYEDAASRIEALLHRAGANGG